MIIGSELCTTKACPKCIKADYRALTVTWNFTAVMTCDLQCGGNTVTITALLMTAGVVVILSPQQPYSSKHTQIKETTLFLSNCFLKLLFYPTVQYTHPHIVHSPMKGDRQLLRINVIFFKDLFPVPLLYSRGHFITLS